MCKPFAYGYPCRWQKRNNECRSVHDEDVKLAFDAYQEKEKIGESLTEGELRTILKGKNDLSENEIKVKKILYMKYPRPPTKKERAELEKEAEAAEMESIFQQMYGLKEDSDDE